MQLFTLSEAGVVRHIQLLRDDDQVVNMEDQFIRTRMLFGNENMDKLSRSKVVVFGIGGVGGYAAEALARCGVGSLVLVDHDVVSLSNLNRQIIALHSTVGRYKTDVMEERILDINPEAKVEVRRCFYLPETADQFDFSDYSYVVDAVDTVTAKLEIIQRAKECMVPVISSMGAGNKTDPSMFRVADIYDTSVCPLARVMRRECRKRGIRDLKVVYSLEPPVVSVSNGKGRQPEESMQETTVGPVSEGKGRQPEKNMQETTVGPVSEGKGRQPEENMLETAVGPAGEKKDCSEVPDQHRKAGRRKDTPGSTAFAPSAAGLLLASYVVKDLIGY